MTMLRAAGAKAAGAATLALIVLGAALVWGVDAEVGDIDGGVIGVAFLALAAVTGLFALVSWWSRRVGRGTRDGSV